MKTLILATLILLGISILTLLVALYYAVLMYREHKAIEKAARAGKPLKVYKGKEYLGEYDFVENEDITSGEGADNG